MSKEYKAGRVDALREVGDYFAAKAEECQQLVKHHIGMARKAREERNELEEKEHEKKWRDALTRKVGYLRALDVVMETEKYN